MNLLNNDGLENIGREVDFLTKNSTNHCAEELIKDETCEGMGLYAMSVNDDLWTIYEEDDSRPYKFGVDEGAWEIYSE